MPRARATRVDMVNMDMVDIVEEKSPHLPFFFAELFAELPASTQFEGSLLSIDSLD